MSSRRGAPPAPAVVGNHFVKQYYGEVLSKKPVDLHRFYTDESTFCHASGTKEEEPVSGLADIKAKIEHLGLGGATVDLGCGSFDAQPSEGGGVLLMVTGSITISGMDPRQFCQTFFLSRQHQDNDRHNYFVRNDIFRFLDVLPEVVQAAYGGRDGQEGTAARAALAMDAAADVVETKGGARRNPEAATPNEQSSPAESAQGASLPASPQAPPAASPPVVTAAVPDASAPPPPPTTMGAAPSSESHPAASASPDIAAGDAGATAVAEGGADVPDETDDKGAIEQPASPSPVAAPESTAPPSASPPSPLTYASLAKSWATVAAVRVEGAASSLPAVVGAPASSSAAAAAAPGSAGSTSGNGNGVAGAPAAAAPASNGGWVVPEPPSSGGAGMAVEQPSLQQGSGGGQGSSRPSSGAGRGTKGGSQYIPHHASPAVAASAAAAREAAAAGNGEILPATSLFVRKVDMTIDKDEMVAHFSAYGDVIGISMNPTRGYAFIDYRSNDCVQSALSTKEHYVNRKLLVVEERHSPMQPRHPRGEHTGRGGRSGGRGRGMGGRDGRDGERGDRRSTGGRGGRGGGLGRGDRSDPKDANFKTRGRPMPA